MAPNVEIYYGPPGTGKTYTLMDILDYELNSSQVPSKEIAMVSFTKKGIAEGTARAKTRFNLSDEDFPYARTIHSLAFTVLGMNRRNVMDAKKYGEFSKKMGMHFTGYYTPEFHHTDDMLLFGDELYRNNKRAGSRYIESLNMDKFIFVKDNFRKYKDTFGYSDFTDMIEAFIRLDKSVPVKVAIIDEAQDLTTLQWRMVWAAFRHCERVYIAGDDDQAIYEWSGADVEYFLSLRGTTHVLSHSYRLPNNFVNFAKRVTRNIQRRATKDYTGLEPKGDLDLANNLDELKIRPNETYMILSRNNSFLSAAETWVQRQGVPYLYKGEAVIKACHINDIRFYEEKRKTRIIDDAEESRLKKLLKEDTDLGKPWYDVFRWDQPTIDYIRTMLAAKPANMLKPLVNISTIHSVKGGEADNVILLSDITRNVHINRDINPDSEHRVFYVGITRAKKTLRIVLPQTKYSYTFS